MHDKFDAGYIWRTGYGKKNQSVVGDRMCPLLFFKSTKYVFNVHGSWHSPNTLPTIVHDLAFRNKT